MELLNLFIRPLIESAVNIRFLIEHGTPEVFDDFVRYSFRTERRLRERIQAHTAEAGGVASPIQNRILNSISRTFDQRGPGSGGTLDGGLANEDPRSVRTSGLNDHYLFQFAVQSHYMHGTGMTSSVTTCARRTTDSSSTPAGAMCDRNRFSQRLWSLPKRLHSTWMSQFPSRMAATCSSVGSKHAARESFESASTTKPS